MKTQRIVQVLSWIAGVCVGLSTLASCGFAQCGEPKPMVTGTFRTLTLAVFANGGGSPPADLAAPFETVEPLSLEIQSDKTVLTYRTPTGNGAVTLEWVDIQ